VFGGEVVGLAADRGFSSEETLLLSEVVPSAGELPRLDAEQVSPRSRRSRASTLSWYPCSPLDLVEAVEVVLLGSNLGQRFDRPSAAGLDERTVVGENLHAEIFVVAPFLVRVQDGR